MGNGSGEMVIIEQGVFQLPVPLLGSLLLAWLNSVIYGIEITSGM